MPSAAPHNIEDYESLLVALQNVLGVVVPEGQRSCLVERVEPLLASYQLDSLAALAAKLQADQAGDQNGNIKSSVLDVISQYQPHWDISKPTLSILHNYIFAQLPANARIWIVGCGQGQPAFATAMEVAEYENKTGDKTSYQLIATESALNDIKQARLASYGTNQLAGLSDEYKKLYMIADNKTNSWKVKDKIAQRVQFEQCDLTEDFQSVGQMDLIICTGVLAYYSNGVKGKILEQFSTMLKSGGIFLAGNYQAVISYTEGFERVEHPAGVFYRQTS